MKHYIDTNNQHWGFDDTQINLIPKDAVLIPDTYTMDQIPYITLVNGVVTYDQAKHDAEQNAIQTAKDEKTSALAKLTALGLTQAEITALIG